MLVLSRFDQASGLYLQSAIIRPGQALRSPTLPFRAAVAGFFVGSPDETL